MPKTEGNKWVSEQACVYMAHTCNLACVYCQHPPNGHRQDPAAWAARLKKRGVKAVSMEGGGEPTANPDFFAWIRALKKSGVKQFMLSTNAVALADEAFCARACKAVNLFTVNFPSHLPEVYARATRSVKYPLALKGLLNLKRLGAGDRLRFFHIVSGFNYKYLPGFSAWIVKNFPDCSVSFVFVQNKGRALLAKGAVPRYSEAAPYIKAALARLKLGGCRAAVQNVPLCALKHFEGFAFEFQRWRRGDAALEGSLEPKAPSRQCALCALEPACCGARRDYLDAHGGRELKASRKAPAAIKPERF